FVGGAPAVAPENVGHAKHRHDPQSRVDRSIRSSKRRTEPARLDRASVQADPRPALTIARTGNAGTLVYPPPFHLALLAAILLLGSGRVVNGYFLADDFGLIHQAVDVNGKPAWSLVLQHLWSGQALESLRPMVTFLHVLGYALWGVRPAGYHV